MFSAWSYAFGVRGIIVVSHDRPEAVRSGDPAQEASAGLSGEGCFLFVAERGHGNKISDEHDQVGMKAVDHADRGMQRMNREKRIVVEIAEHGDGEAIEPFGPALEAKHLTHDAREVRSQKDSVSDDGDCADRGSSLKKLASCGGDQRQTKITR
jgi:hypothetical protein